MCACVRVCALVYLYVRLCICASVSACAPVNEYMRVYVYVDASVHMCVYACVRVCVLVYVNVRLCTCMWWWTNMCACVSVRPRVRACARVGKILES